MTQHQRNFQLIQQLRSTSDALDERTKSTLSALADLRHELISSTPVSLPPGDGKSTSLDASVLLKFAQQIARPTSVPSRGIASATTVVNDVPVDSVETSVKREPGTPQMPNGADADSGAKALMIGEQSSATEKQGKAVSSLDPGLRAWLASPDTHAIFTPWIAEDQSRKSALSRIEETWSRDVDPATIITDGEANSTSFPSSE